MRAPTIPASDRPLVPADAVCAIIVTQDRRFPMQHRDPHPHIWYPDAGALFGGAMEPGESELDALRREVHEEIDYTIDLATVRLFSRFRFELDFAGLPVCTRAIYDVPIEADAVATMRLNEGAAMRLVPADEVLALPGLTGYD